VSAPGGAHSAAGDLQLLLHPVPMQMAFIGLSGLKRRWGMPPRGRAPGPALPAAAGRGDAAAPHPLSPVLAFSRLSEQKIRRPKGSSQACSSLGGGKQAGKLTRSVLLGLQHQVISTGTG